MPDTFSPIFILGVLLSLGSLAGLLSEKLNLPRVIGYVLIGALFSPGILGDVVHFSTEGWSPLLTDLALGIIAYIIGSEIDLKNIRRKEATIIAAVVGQALGVFIVVGLGLWILNETIGFSSQIGIWEALLFAAVATAAAPASTLEIIEEYKAEGKLTDTTLGVIAVADAISVILFTLVLGINTEGGFANSTAEGFTEVAGALFLGTIMGGLLGYLGNRLKKEELRLVIILGFVFVVFGLAQLFNFSILLSCISLGLVSVLFYKDRQAEWLVPLEHIEELVFIFFFTLAGVHFDFSVFTTSAMMIIAYIVLRSIGKYAGAFGGLLLISTEKKTRRYLGLCLLPQAGVAIGLAIKAGNQAELNELGSLLLNVVLGSTIVFELTAPVLTKHALEKAGEIKQ